MSIKYTKKDFLEALEIAKTNPELTEKIMDILRQFLPFKVGMKKIYDLLKTIIVK